MAQPHKHGLAVRESHTTNRLLRQTGKVNLLAGKPPVPPKPLRTVQGNVVKQTTTSFKVYEDSPVDENNVIHMLEKRCREEEIKKVAQLKKSPQVIVRPDDEALYFSARSHTTDTSIRTELQNLDMLGAKVDCQPNSSLVEEEDFQSLPEDDHNRHEAHFCSTFDFDDQIYEYMRDRETKMRPRRDFLKRQKEITPEMRHILIDWMSDVVREYNMCQETLHLAISIVDRSLSRFLVQREKLQLVGATALMIAAKVEEVYPPETKDYIYMTDDTYKSAHLLMMEQAILSELNFDISSPTAAWFANRITSMATINEATRFAMEYLLDLALLDTSFVDFRPSYVAAACICYANVLCESTAWSKQLEECSGIRLEHLKKIYTKLHEAYLKAPNAEQRAIYNHYADRDMHEVSKMNPPSRTPFD